MRVLLTVMKQFSRRIDRANIGDIEHADRNSDHGEDRAETFEVAKTFSSTVSSLDRI